MFPFLFVSMPSSIIKRFIIIAVTVLWLWPSVGYAQKRVHSVYFEGTDYELHVYRIFGKQSGHTLMLIGGIQGDEPGGFLSADLYADISLVKGNLIVVPRANFQSIVLKRRQINEDMNRTFSNERRSNYEAKVVAILKQLIQESDVLLNLHDGSGFYSDTWEGPNRNPMRFGQSIIADCDTFINPQNSQVIQLGEMAKHVIERINKQISNPRHHFHFNNHRTNAQDSLHKEQRKSATYFALFTRGIPAFGVETSKSLPLETKVRHHNIIINAFMDRFDIIPETPGLNLENPDLNYLVIAVNDTLPVVVKKNHTLFINPGDFIRISHIEANYERGLSADIKGIGSLNDSRKKFVVQHPTRIVVRKDFYPCGTVFLDFNAGHTQEASDIRISVASAAGPAVRFFKIRTNGKTIMVPNGDRVLLNRGDVLEIIDVIADGIASEELIVNFKGFVGNKRYNTGEDRGYPINTKTDLWSRYSLQKLGKSYQIVVTLDERKIGKLIIDLKDPV